MILDFANLNRGQAYQVMTHSIIPRPVAWILTKNENASLNLAPFSYFQAIGSQPATVMVSIGNKPDGGKKDTQLNIERDRQCVIHIANTELASAVNQSAKSLPYNESEVTEAALDTETVANWPLPRLAQAPIAFLSQLVKVDEIAGMNVIYLQLLSGWLDDAVLAPAPMPDTPDLPAADKLNPLARLGFTSYSGLSEVFNLVRPK